MKRTMSNTWASRYCCLGPWPHRKRITAFILITLCLILTVALFTKTSHLPHEDEMERQLAEMQIHLQFLESLYLMRHEEVLNLYKMVSEQRNISLHRIENDKPEPPSLPPDLLRNISGTKTASGLNPPFVHALKTRFIYQLLPHLMESINSLQPAFYLSSDRGFADVVIGIPTVKRDKGNYLLTTLQHLIKGLTEADFKSTLIVVYIGETDLEYVVDLAMQIELKFRQYIVSGLIELISPSADYYPDMEKIPPTLGDSKKRSKWRTKQNLDTLYLMAYAQTKGKYFLMLEDDVIAKSNFMQQIKQFTAEVTVINPNWFFVDFSNAGGGFGKLFRTSTLFYFTTYIQIFYYNLPIDWLMESYLADRVCSVDKNNKSCGKSKNELRPVYKPALFSHIGVFSSLKGKVHKNSKKLDSLDVASTYFPHTNPPLKMIVSDIEQIPQKTLEDAYFGRHFFWGRQPKEGDVIEFWFEKPTFIETYIFRSGNLDVPLDRFYNAVVETLQSGETNFTLVGEFDEFGLAEGKLSKELNPVDAIRIRNRKSNTYWVILSEIYLKTFEGTR